MAVVSSFVFCDTVQYSMVDAISTVTDIKKVYAALVPLSMPGLFSFSIFFNIRGFDTNVDNRLHIYFVDPDDAVLHDAGEEVIKGGLVFPPSPEEYRSIAVSIDFRNVVLSKAGMHKIFIHLNDEIVSTQMIPVYCTNGGEK